MQLFADSRNFQRSVNFDLLQQVNLNAGDQIKYLSRQKKMVLLNNCVNEL